MKKTHNKTTLIMFTIVILIIGICFHFSKNLNSGVIARVVYGATLESSSTDTVTSSGSSKISEDISFLTTLIGSLEKIKIDTDFFTSKLFLSLKDNSISIGSVEPGRINPFFPMENSNINNTVFSLKVITDLPTEITDKEVMLNGTINTTDGVTNVYFEYGKTNTLGTVVTTIEPSLIGAFIKNILGLTPKTNYFYKACAKINNIANCGEIVSFSTK